MKFNIALYISLYLTLFTQQNNFEVHLCCVYQYSISLLLSSIYFMNIVHWIYLCIGLWTYRLGSNFGLIMNKIPVNISIHDVVYKYAVISLS